MRLGTIGKTSAESLVISRLAFFILAPYCSLLLASSVLSAEPKASEKMTLRSPAFQPGADIPRKYTCDADDVSPPLRWESLPAGTQALALIADDPDAPGGTWVHWVVYDLTADIAALNEAIPKTETLANGAKQGANDFRRVGFGGPCPPPGPAHRYYFKLYALDAPTALKPRATKAQLLEAIKGHVLGEAELMGRYKR
jgi:Raf kinase inhibitor-like YbhB/YbcL family protein